MEGNELWAKERYLGKYLVLQLHPDFIVAILSQQRNPWVSFVWTPTVYQVGLKNWGWDSCPQRDVSMLVGEGKTNPQASEEQWSDWPWL